MILRKQHDHSDKDKKLLYLYRLLAIKYRVVFPLKGESFKLDEDLRIVLETKICNAALNYFNSVPEGYKAPPEKKAAAAARAAQGPSAASRSRSATGTSYSSNSVLPPWKVGKAKPRNPPHQDRFSNDYVEGGQQQMKPPMIDTYASTNMATTSVPRGPSASTDRRVHFEDDYRLPETTIAPQGMVSSGFMMSDVSNVNQDSTSRQTI